jgi:hypothetical protein
LDDAAAIHEHDVLGPEVGFNRRSDSIKVDFPDTGWPEQRNKLTAD